METQVLENIEKIPKKYGDQLKVISSLSLEDLRYDNRLNANQYKIIYH